MPWQRRSLLAFSLTALAAMILACGGTTTEKRDPDPNPSDQAALQGTWKVHKVEFPEGAKDFDGILMQSTEPFYRSLRFNVTNNVVTIRTPKDDPQEKDLLLGMVVLSLDASKSPKEVDFTPRDEKGNPAPGKNPVRGIYKFEGGILVVALGPIRPVEFRPLMVKKNPEFVGDHAIAVLHLKKE